MNAALALLEAHGYLRLERQQAGKQGGRPSERIVVSPALRDSEALDGTDKTAGPAPVPKGSVSSVGRIDEPSELSAKVEHVDLACREGRRWLARDGIWRCLVCAPWSTGASCNSPRTSSRLTRST